MPTMVPVPRMDSISGKHQGATRIEELRKPMDRLMVHFIYDQLTVTTPALFVSDSLLGPR